MDEKLVNVYPYNKILDEEIDALKNLKKLTDLLFENSRLRFFNQYFYRTDDPRFEFNEKDVLLDKITINNSMRILNAVVGLFIISMAVYLLLYQGKKNVSISIIPILLLFGVPTFVCFYAAFKKYITFNFETDKLKLTNVKPDEYEVTAFYYTDIHDAFILITPHKQSRRYRDHLILILKNNSYHRIELNEIDSKKVAYNIEQRFKRTFD